MSNSVLTKAFESSSSSTEESIIPNEIFHNWVLERVHSLMHGNILVVDCHAKTINNFCSKHSLSLTIVPLEFMSQDFYYKTNTLQGSFDIVYAIGYNTNIVTNTDILQNCYNLLRQGGHIITSLPANTGLYNELKQGIELWDEHNKMFCKKTLLPHFKLIKHRYFMSIPKIENIDYSEQNNAQKTSNRYRQNIPFFSFKERNNYFGNGISLIVVGLKREII